MQSDLDYEVTILDCNYTEQVAQLLLCGTMAQLNCRTKNMRQFRVLTLTLAYGGLYDYH